MERFSPWPGGMGRAVGYQIKRFRQARRMSVSELARQSGVSKATLSLLELGQGNPTIETVAAIAAGLRLPLGDLIQIPMPDEPVIRHGTDTPTDSKQELLHRIPSGVSTEIWRLRISSSGQTIESPAHGAGTAEYILVERGPMMIGEAEHPVRLESGDFVIFRSDVPHVYQACADNVEAVVIMSYPASVLPSDG